MPTKETTPADGPEKFDPAQQPGIPVEMTAQVLLHLQQKNANSARQMRLKQLARRNRDVAWLLEQVPAERTPRSVKAPKPTK